MGRVRTLCQLLLSLSSITMLAPSALQAAQPATPTGKVHFTYPMPPRPKPTDPMRVAPGYEVPEYPDRYTWKIAAAKAPGVAAATAARAFSFDSWGRPGVVGSVPEGTTLKLSTIRRVGTLIFYAAQIPVTANGQTINEVWIDGRDIAPASYTPPAK